MASELDKLFRTIEAASSGFERKLPAIEQKLLEELLLLLKQFEVKNGKVLSNVANLNLMSRIKGKLEKLVLSKEYVKDVTDFVRSFSTIASLQEAYFTGASGGGKAKAYHAALQKAAVEQTVEGLTATGVRSNVLKPVSDILLTGITSGQSYAQMESSLRQALTDTKEGLGALSRYARTYTTDSVNQFSREYMAALTSDLGYEWYAYLGTNIETTREFCEHLSKKEYIHKSELPEILKGNIDGHQCRIYDKTGLPYGMKEGTTVDNFKVNCGGWNCGHQLVPVPEGSVPEAVRYSITQKENV
jgi:hypothetical protein